MTRHHSFTRLASAAARQIAETSESYLVEFWDGDRWQTVEGPMCKSADDVDERLCDSGDLWGLGCRVTKITRENGQPYDVQDVTRAALERVADRIATEHDDTPAEYAWIEDAVPQVFADRARIEAAHAAHPRWESHRSNFV